MENDDLGRGQLEKPMIESIAPPLFYCACCSL